MPTTPSFSDNMQMQLINMIANGESLAQVREFIKLTYESGGVVDFRTPDNNGNTPLHHAVLSGHLEVVLFLVEHGAANTIETQNNDGCTPVHYAAVRGSVACLHYLVEHGVDISQLDNNGCTPLHYAASGGSVACLDYLVEHGSDIRQLDNNGCTPLHYATSGGSVECLDYLVEHGSDISQLDNNGCTPLHYAASGGSVECLGYLVEKGGDIRQKANNGCTPLHYAAQTGFVECLYYLVEKGGDISQFDSYGCTPLHYAARRPSVEWLDYLVEKGGDISRPDSYGDTPLHHAATMGFLGVVRYLVQKTGSDIDKPDNNGRTPLELARVGSHVEVEKYLRKEIVRRMLKDRERILPGLLQKDEIASEETENPVTNIGCPLHIYSPESIGQWLERSPNDPFTRQPLTATDIIPVFSARNVFLVAARNALAKLDSDEAINGQASDNNIHQFDRRTLELELLLLDPESVLCAEHYLKQFCTDGRAVYRQPTPEKQKLFEELGRRIFIGSEDGSEPAEIGVLKQYLNKDGSIKPDLVSPADERSLNKAKVMQHSGPLLFDGLGHSSLKPETEETGSRKLDEKKTSRPD